MTDCNKEHDVKKHGKNTLNQCRALLTPYLTYYSSDEIEEDMEELLSGLSETSKYPGKLSLEKQHLTTKMHSQS